MTPREASRRDSWSVTDGDDLERENTRRKGAEISVEHEQQPAETQIGINTHV